MDKPGEVLSQLDSEDLVTRISEVYEAPLKAVNIANLLTLIGIHPDLIMKLYRFFGSREFDGDLEDIINLDDISQEQLIQRLANACRVLVKEAQQVTELTEIERGDQSSSSDSTAEVEVAKETKQLVEVQLEELLQGAEDSKAVITAAIEGGHGEGLRVLASQLGCEVDDEAVGSFVGYVLEADLRQSELLDQVKRSSNALGKTYDAGGRSCTFEDFVRLLSAWMTKQPSSSLELPVTLQPLVIEEPSIDPQPSISPKFAIRQKPILKASLSVTESITKDQIEATIEETLKKYEALRQLRHEHASSQAIESIIRACQLQLRYSVNTATKPKQQRSLKWLSRCRQGLSEIFHFYARQVLMIGKDPSFADISQANSSWTLSKFIKFLKDFGLSEAPVGRRSLSKMEACDIFVKFAYLRKSLNEAAFMQTLTAVAEAYYNAEYDQGTETKMSGQSAEEKLYKLYDGLECSDVAKYSKKMKGFGIAFSSDTNSRIPPNDPAKRYRFKASKKALEELDGWKKRNPRIADRSIPAPKARSPIERRLEEKSKSSVSHDISFGGQSKIGITWKKLGEMSFDQIKDPNDDFDIRDLIVDTESDDEKLNMNLPMLKLTKAPPKRTRRLELSMLGRNSYSIRSRLKVKP
jgi:hypothetical protein